MYEDLTEYPFLVCTVSLLSRYLSHQIYDENAIHEMTARTQKYFKDSEPVDLAGELRPGQAVMAQYLSDDDDKWYRARVEKVLQLGGVDKVDVVFIEFGNTERVLPHQVRGIRIFRSAIVE